MIAYLAATWLGINAGIATALTAAYRRHNRHLTARGEAGADLMARPSEVPRPDLNAELPPDVLMGNLEVRDAARFHSIPTGGLL